MRLVVLSSTLSGNGDGEGDGKRVRYVAVCGVAVRQRDGQKGRGDQGEHAALHLLLGPPPGASHVSEGGCARFSSSRRLARNSRTAYSQLVALSVDPSPDWAASSAVVRPASFSRGMLSCACVRISTFGPDTVSRLLLVETLCFNLCFSISSPRLRYSTAIIVQSTAASAFAWHLDGRAFFGSFLATWHYALHAPAAETAPTPTAIRANHKPHQPQHKRLCSRCHSTLGQSRESAMYCLSTRLAPSYNPARILALLCVYAGCIQISANLDRAAAPCAFSCI